MSGTKGNNLGVAACLLDGDGRRMDELTAPLSRQEGCANMTSVAGIRRSCTVASRKGVHEEGEVGAALRA
jgi:hypothetical protein